jgi:hypothetical protein
MANLGALYRDDLDYAQARKWYIQPLKGRKFAKWLEESFLVSITTSLAIIGILAKGSQVAWSPAKQHWLFGHDITNIVSDPLLTVLCLVGPLFVIYLLLKLLLLWNWRYISSR